LRKEILMSSSSAPLSTPEGPGSVSGAPNLPEGFTDTFTSRYVDTGELRLHAVIAVDQRGIGLFDKPHDGYYIDRLASDPEALRGSFELYRALDVDFAQSEERKTRRFTMSVLVIGGTTSIGDQVTNTMKLVADDVQSVVIPGSGHWLAEEAPDEFLAALRDFLAPYRESGGGLR
jgi:pimeloyl-ACP methyl ester carboxylesterase